MARILTGVQSTGTPHLGNLLGAVLPAIEMAKATKDDSFLFIADLHSLTQIKNGKKLRENTFSTAATWMACGLDIEKTHFYRQSDVSEVTELTWYLNCYFPYQRLTLAHSFKDKSEDLTDVNTGLFSYPMLMAADILLYDAEVVPVGKDQLQHLEITRDVASRFNHQMGETFVIPRAKIQESTQNIPGTDGQKMSKSKNNTINIFLSEKKLRKQIMSIQTDSTPMEAPKDPTKVLALIPNPSEPKSRTFFPFQACFVKSFLALISNALIQNSLVFKNFNMFNSTTCTFIKKLTFCWKRSIFNYNSANVKCYSTSNY